MKIIFTKHSQAMLKERALKREFVAAVVQQPQWREEGEGNAWLRSDALEVKISAWSWWIKGTGK